MSDNFTDEEIMNRLDAMAEWDTATNEMATEDHIGYMAARIIERLLKEVAELEEILEEQRQEMMLHGI